MPTIYLFRHGQTTYNRDGKFTGYIDAPLSSKGKEDAKIIAERLRDKKFGIAIHTRLSRSKDTLKEVLKKHNECQLVMEDDRMIERNYGKFNGKKHLTIIKEKGINAYDHWHRSYTARPPGGESFADVEKRVSAFIKDLKKIAKENNTNIAISAHGNSIRVFRKIMEHLTRAQAEKLEISFDNYYSYKL